jgi:monothiol glutaredoxin
MSTLEQIKTQIGSNPVIIYMKGTPDFPQCGFSARACDALKALKANFAYIDVLANPEIRAELPKYANWPTFPQLYINHELVGGSDIIHDYYTSGELQRLLDKLNQPASEE